MSEYTSRENIHSGLSGLKDDTKWKNVLNLRFADRRTKVVPKKLCLFNRDAGFHTIVNGLDGVNYALGSKESWGFVGAESLCFFRLWRLRQEYKNQYNDRSEASQRLFVRGKYTGDVPLRVRVTVVEGRLVLDSNWPEPPPPVVPTPPNDFGCACDCGTGNGVVNLEGVVRNAVTLLPIATTVLIKRQGVTYYIRTTDDISGYYFVADIDPGVYDIYIEQPGYQEYTASVEIAENVSRFENLVPTISNVFCGVALNSTGGQGYEEYIINLGNDLGICTLTYNAISVPDRFVVEWNGNAVIDTGFRGDPSYDEALAELSLGPVSGPGEGTASFEKTSAFPNLVMLKVYAPLDDTAWSANLGCPTSPP